MQLLLSGGDIFSLSFGSIAVLLKDLRPHSVLSRSDTLTGVLHEVSYGVDPDDDFAFSPESKSQGDM